MELKIIRDENKTSLEVDSDGVDFKTLLNILAEAELSILNTVCSEATKETDTKEAIRLKQYIYDFYNVLSSAVLKTFAPEFELNPNFNPEDIIKAEDTLLEELDNAQDSDRGSN